MGVATLFYENKMVMVREKTATATFQVPEDAYACELIVKTKMNDEHP